MAIDLSTELRKTLNDTVSRAESAYQSQEDGKAATLYESACRILLRLADGAPSRRVEVDYKQRAIKYREYSRRLRAGEVPPPSQTSDDAPSGGKGSGKAAIAERSTGSVSKGSRDKGRSNRPARDGSDSKDELSQIVGQLIHSSSITWDQIGGLEETKAEIKYSLGISLARKPDGVKLQTWRNMLFYGPPGTGKTLLAAATSNALRLSDTERAVFFNVKVSSVMSKYFGESTKIISETYGTARDCSPAVVFLDEFESLCASRDDSDSGTERRILSTILSELDGLAEKGRSDIYVLTIAATNRPWDLDAAILSRFDKKILIPLPDKEACEAILGLHLVKRGFEMDCDIGQVATMCEGFSGREIDGLCKEVTNRMVAECNDSLPGLVDGGLDKARKYEIKIRPLTMEDFKRARTRIHPLTSPKEMQRYRSWAESNQES